jgi:hypothetical protein
MQGRIPISRATLDPHTTGIPTPQLCCQIHDHWDLHHLSAPGPSLELVPQLPGISVPPSLMPFRLCWAPATHRTTLSPPLRLLSIRTCRAPAPCATPGAQPSWDRQQPCERQLHPPAHEKPRPSGRAGPSSTGLPDNHSTRVLLRPPLEVSKCT